MKNNAPVLTKTKSVKLIYNPYAGRKRQLLSVLTSTSLEQIRQLLRQYQILFDEFPTKSPQHATTLAREALAEGYQTVIAAGGDGTIAEVANGLVGSNISLGIIPLGTFMNTARMLSIPNDLEKAVMLIKLGRTRKIDVGVVCLISGEKINQPFYFIETAGIGIDADLQQHTLDLERGNLKAILKIIGILFDFYGHKATITLDKKEIIETKATMVTVSNGPFTGAALKIAPEAKLNDHKLTVSLYKMSKIELIKHFFKMWSGARLKNKKIKTYQAAEVKVETKKPRPIHADACLFGTTPVEFKIQPNALNVITGFPNLEENPTLVKRTQLDP